MSLVLHLVFTFAAFYLLFAFLLQFMFWYESLNEPCKEAGTRPFTFRRAAEQFFGFVAAHGARPFCPLLWRLFARKRAGSTDAEAPLVILVHGIYDEASTWILMESRLRRDGYRTAQFGYSSFGRTIEDIVEDFHAFLRSFEGRKPVLVGHSNGGIVIRSWLLQKKCASLASGVVTISTPHTGSKLAVFGPGRLVDNLRPGSALLSAIADDDSSSLPCTALASGADEMVLPASRLLPPKSWKFRMTGHQNHLGMLFNATVYGILKEELVLIGEAAKTVPDEASRQTDPLPFS